MLRRDLKQISPDGGFGVVALQEREQFLAVDRHGEIAVSDACAPLPAVAKGSAKPEFNCRFVTGKTYYYVKFARPVSLERHARRWSAAAAAAAH